MKRRAFNSFREAVSVVAEGKDVHALRDFNFMNSGQPPSVGALAENLGFSVEFRDLPREVSGLLEPDLYSRKGFRIVVNGNHSTVRQRFTALHEIAHYYLHPHYTDELSDAPYRASVDGIEHFYPSDEELLEEREANEWVEAVVFGQKALNEAVQLHGEDNKAIARKFGVSLTTLQIVRRKRRL